MIMSTAKYQVIPLGERFQGLGYSDLVVSWMKWLVSLNPDSNNNGPVVFLRGMDLPADGAYGGAYGGGSGLFTSIRVGKNKFTICDNQAILLPNITYYIDSFHHPQGDRLGLLMQYMSAGVIPQRNNIAINGDPIVNNPEAYQIITPEFDLDIPDSSTLGQFLDEPFTQPGTFKCISGAYAYLIRFLEPGEFTITSHGQGEGGYVTTIVADLTVLKCGQNLERVEGLGTFAPSQLTTISTRDLPSLISKLEDQASTDDFDKRRLPTLKEYIYKCYGIKH